MNDSTIFSNISIKVTYTAIQNTDLFCWDYGVESVLSYLPLSHVAGQMMDVFLIMSKVSRTWKIMTRRVLWSLQPYCRAGLVVLRTRTRLKELF